MNNLPHSLLHTLLGRAVESQKTPEANLKEYLRHVDTIQLVERISQFRDLDFKQLSSAEISRRFMDVLLFGTSKGKRLYLLPTNVGTYTNGQKFFRVRKLGTQAMELPLRGMEVEADAWEAPAEYVRAGRLNKDEESLLYTAPGDLSVAIEETKIADGDIFSAIVYQAIEPVRCTRIGIPTPDLRLSSEEQLKLRLVLDFMRHEFIREVGQGTEHLYKISEALAKDNFDLPELVSDGWCYPSVAKKGGVNMCFRPHIARKKLSLLGVMICSARRLAEDYEIKVHRVAHGFDQSGKFIYHSIGSEIQKTIFPEIR